MDISQNDSCKLETKLEKTFAETLHDDHRTVIFYGTRQYM